MKHQIMGGKDYENYLSLCSAIQQEIEHIKGSDSVEAVGVAYRIIENIAGRFSHNANGRNISPELLENLLVEAVEVKKERIGKLGKLYSHK